MDFRPVLMICGLFITTLSLLMLFPVMVDFMYHDQDWRVFWPCVLSGLFAGNILYFSNKCKIEKLDIKQSLCITIISWFCLPIIAAFPFYVSVCSHSFADAYFEATSGLSTTGATVLVGLDNMPPGILLWRSILNLIGGVGIVVMAVSLLPYLGVGGMAMFSFESSENTEKITPKIKNMALSITVVYSALVFLCYLSLKLAGMNNFDAINHAMTTISTGGFSTKDASVGFFNNPLYEIILVVFMISGALPLTYYVRIFQGTKNNKAQFKQIKGFLKTLFIFVSLILIWLIFREHYPTLTSIRHTIFNVTSILTDCGFSSANYSQWGSFAVLIFFILPLIGGCTGSTSGSIKIFRWQIFIKYLKEVIRNIYTPHRALSLKYGDKPFDKEVVLSVTLFISLYFATFCVMTILVSFTGLDILSSSSAVGASMANSGPGLGDVLGPAGNYKPLTDMAKYILSFSMVLGRLEIIPVMVFFSRRFWIS